MAASISDAKMLARMKSPSLHMDQIADRLWLGNQDAADDTDTLMRLGIRFILSIREPGIRSYLDAKESKQITYRRVWALDANDEVLPLAECASYINSILKSGESLLVHCYSGQSRSPAVVCAYLIRHCGIKSTTAAIQHIGSENKPKQLGYRTVWPNKGFHAQLDAFARRVHEEWWASFVPTPVVRLSI